ncbi:MAG: glycosyltransferase, partial [Ruminiclostridium sp.]|nr:glycosyltransferase [Ruminiclostridium sp.]
MNEKLNVCLLNDSFPPLIDGVATAVINYANIIQHELGNATVVTPSYPGAEDNYDCPVVRYSSLATEKQIGYRAGYPFSASKLEALKNSMFDVIHSHCPFASTVFARNLKEKNGAPLIMTYHTKFNEDIKRVIDNPLLEKQITKFVVQNISVCDEVWTVSRGAGENLRSIGYEGNYVIMPNGVDFPKGRASKEDAEALRAECGAPPEIPLFLFVGRLFWYKGFRVILDSLKYLSESGIEYRMLVVGDGSDAEEIKAEAERLGIMDKMIFAGAINDRTELRVYYTASDLFLFPSEYDTNGIVVREAAACGLPSLLIKGSCAAEDFTHYQNAILCENDAFAVSKELIHAASHLDALKDMGEHAMNDVYLSWEDAV